MEIRIYFTFQHVWGGHFNKLRPKQNGRHFADDIFKCIFLNEYVRISIKTSLKFVPRGPINNITALVQIMAWRLTGDKPLSEPMMVKLPTHICVTRPQWVKVAQVRDWVPKNSFYTPESGIFCGTRRCPILIYVNNIAHIAETMEKMQAMLAAIETWRNIRRLRVNPSKSQVPVVHPCSKVIGFFFCDVKWWYSFSMYSFEFFRVEWWGLLHLLWIISRVFVTAPRLCEHSNLVRFEKCAAKTPQHGLRYGNILMLYDIINTHEWLFLL